MATALVELLSLVFELVDGEVDRRVEVVRRLLGEHRLMIGLERDLGDVPLLGYAQDDVRLDRPAEVLLHALELLFGVGTEGRRRIDVAERDQDLHQRASSWSRALLLGTGGRGPHRRWTISVNLLPFRRGQDAHQLPVLRDRAAGNVDLLLAEQLGDVLVAERLL